jgi:acetolactate synthase-1/3 small subunit
MLTHAHDGETETMVADNHMVLELTVNNHPGVMSHICGLFARRAFNLSGILCMPLQGNRQSRIWLLVEDGDKVDQIVKQVAKLEDVLEVRNQMPERQVFLELESFFLQGTVGRDANTPLSMLSASRT